MKSHVVNTYDFDELTDEAKEKAREWWLDGAFHHDWWDAVYEDAKRIGEIIGVQIKEIGFSGFSSQGDGACIEGRYSYKKGSAKRIREYSPEDEELHRIADELQSIQKKHFYRLGCEMKQAGRYSHEYSIDFVFDYDGEELWQLDEDSLNRLVETMRDFMRWIYRALEKEYEWLSSDESVDENIRINEYEFTEVGIIF